MGWIWRIYDVKKNAHRFLEGKNEGKKALGRPGFRW